MCSEVCEKLSIGDLEQLLVLNCAPVFAGIKISNLIVTNFEGYRKICNLLKGTLFELYVLSRNRGKVSILVFERSGLQAYLNKAPNAKFLKQMGYCSNNLDKVLLELAMRYKMYLSAEACFPHELGIVLGYPIEDVYGFICNKGENYICSGYWKVYSQAEQTMELFKFYDDVTENMMIRLLETRNLREMLAKRQSIS